MALVVSGTLAAAGEIDYVEDFALAKDRPAALKQLIPGTEDYYYYHCLYLQQTEQFDKVEEQLKLWLTRHGRTGRLIEIENRQALLTYPTQPAKALEFLRQRIGVQYNHQRELLRAKPNLPVALDQKRISREVLAARAVAVWPNSVEGFEDASFDWLLTTVLTPDQRRQLLSRLTRPDYPNLVKLIVDDLAHQYSQGFGAMPVHRQLTLMQLEELLKLKPELLNQTQFVTIYLTKLQPSGDLDWRNDPVAHLAYLERLWAFAARLAPAHNSLKAHVLYQRLHFDLTRGEFDKERFLAYLRLPRNIHYMQPKWLQAPERRDVPADLNADFRAQTLCPPIGNDEALVRAYLAHFFLTETSYEEYVPIVNEQFLKHLFAETKILNGLGEPEQWYSLLPPEQYQALKERIDIDFAPTNKTVFGAGEPVSLDLHIKNVQALIVKVYEVNSFNYYKANLKEVDTDINLDGLVANEERTHLFSDPPLRRVKRHFEFAGLAKPGTYVIDFIGNGRSSRALIRKGKLHYTVRSGGAGQVFTILDEANAKLPDASLWLAGREFKADASGTIVVPYSNAPARTPIILSHGNVHTLEFFSHESENYALAAGIYVDRQTLLLRRKAKVVIRPSLTVNGTPISLKLLEKVKLRVVSTDIDGVSSTVEAPDFKLLEDREAHFEFQVPPRLSQIRFVLSAQVQNLSQNKKIDLAVDQEFGLNEVDKTDKVEDLHLLQLPGGFALELLGKTGEAKPDRAVSFSLKHKDFKEPVSLVLQTNPAGRIDLGALADIVSVTATGPEGTSHTWTLPRDRHTYHATLNGVAGQPLAIPYMGSAAKVERAAFSLLEVRGDTFVADRFAALSLQPGMLQVAGLEPGDYDLWLKESDTHIRLAVTAGEVRDGYVLGAARQLELRGRKPLQIVAISAGDKGEVKIQLANAGKFARVHVFVGRYLPAFDAYRHVSIVRDPEPYRVFVPRLRSSYVEGRNIGDEYRYILDRKYAPKFAGNMLNRPSLLLNPWAIRKTETSQQAAQEGEEFAESFQRGESHGGRGAREGGGNVAIADFANLDFLAQAATVLLNAAPDENGVLTFTAADLGGHQHLHVVAVDPEMTVYRHFALQEKKPDYYDLRLAGGLDPKIHYTQQKQVTIVAPGKPFVLADIGSAKFEAYDSLARVYGFYRTLTADPKLAEFSFILGWPQLKPEEKQKLYSKFACHELNFFLLKKDPEFFRTVVLPYTKHKRDKTFLDQWLVAAANQTYLAPWSYERLNIVERILLSQRIAGEAQYTSRHVQDLFALIPPNIEEANRLFAFALRGNALETSDRWGLTDAREKSLELGLLPTGDEPAPAVPAPEAANGPFGGVGGGAVPAAPPPGMAATPRPTEPAAQPSSANKQLARPQAEATKAKDEARKYRAYGYANGRDRADKKAEKEALQEMDGAEFYFDAESGRRQLVRQLYQKIDTTQEWAENNYYHLAIEDQNADLVRVNAFWRDYARHDPAQPFLSPHFVQASRNFTEIMFALSVLDLPFEAGKHETKYEGAALTLVPASPTIAFHEEIRPARSVADKTPILVSQNFFRYGDRHRTVDNEQVDKYVTDEFLVQVVYGCQIVVTNPTSSRQKLEVLLQVPVGAIPVLGGQETRSVSIQLEPYHTQTIEYHFYFPKAGEFRHYPVQVAKNEELLAAAAPFTFKVVDELSKLDTESWDYVSQHGTDEQVVGFLQTHNLHQINLERIAWRMRNPAYFRTVTDLLAARHAYNHALWSYSLLHNVPPAIRQFLQHCDDFLVQTGAYLDSPLVTIDPVVRKSYQHLEYAPLVNARAHALGRRRQILNDRFFEQYHQLLHVLKYRRELSHDDWLSVTYYLLLQDRVGEALEAFGKINPQTLETRLQYDYFAAYLDFFTDDHKLARGIATRYLAHPVDRWRQAFTAIVAQLDELEGRGVQVVDDQNRDQQQTALASTESSFDFKVEAKKVVVTYQKVDEITVNYYLMDVELLFSRNPFVQQFAGQFSFIKPNGSQNLKLPPNKSSFEFELPEQLHNSNVLVEVVAAGESKTQAYYSNSLAVAVVENYGQVRVGDGTGKPLAKVYIKVYAEMQNGETKFYKDGYTDLRGRFDYTSVNTNELDFVKRFSLLILSEQNGAIVKEASPPKR